MVKTMFVLGMLVAWVACSSSEDNQMSIVSGKLLGYDGKSMTKAHVHLSHDSWIAKKPLQSIEVAKNGSFEIKFTETGVRHLNFTGVNHYAHTVALLVEEPTHIKLHVRLKHYEYLDNFNELKIIGDFNNFSLQSPQQMTQQEDGSFIFENDDSTSTFAYQILGVEKSGLITTSGTQSDDFAYDGKTVKKLQYDIGGYHSVLKISNGKIKIVFDPAKLIHDKSNEKAVVQFKSAIPLQEKFYTLDRQLYQIFRKWRVAVEEYRAAHPNDRMFSGFSYDWSDNLNSFANSIAREKDPIVRQILLVQYLRLASNVSVQEKLDKSLIRQALEEVPATSRLWEIYRPILSTAIYLTGETEKYENYANQALEQHPDRYVRAAILDKKLRDTDKKGDTTQVRVLFTRFMNEFGDLDIAKYVEKQYSPTMKGKKVPTFSIASMDEPGVTYTNESLKGKVYLIDFWGTWCGPCIGEMPYHHAAYEKFKDRGFTILSLACDEAPDDVIQFRKGEWKMPWLHGFLQGCMADKNDLEKKFKVVGYPTSFLVGPDQTILAIGQELRAEKLELALSRIFSKELAKE